MTFLENLAVMYYSENCRNAELSVRGALMLMGKGHWTPQDMIAHGWGVVCQPDMFGVLKFIRLEYVREKDTTLQLMDC